MNFYLKEKEEVYKNLSSNPEGLSESEASLRLEKNGKNKLIEAKKDSLVKKLLKQIADPMIIVLLVAAVISAVVAVYAQESFADVFVILSI